jgi:predicted DNA-binding transcriptional regulator YafY
MAFARRLAILRMLPRHPRRMATAEIHRRLQDQGYDTDLRTIQRDLDMLSGIPGLPVGCDDRARNNLAWYWDSQEVFDLAAMDPPTALTFALMGEHFAPLLPPMVRRHLDPHVRNAERILDSADDNVLRDWSKRVRVLPRGQQQIGPEVSADIADVIYEAVLTARRFTGVYRARYTEDRPEARTFDPLGLLLRDRTAYLVAVVAPHTEPVYLALHRFESATLGTDPAQVPDDFDLDAFIADKTLDFRLGDPIRFEFVMDADAAHHIVESPLGADQAVRDIKDGRKRFAVTVDNTQLLRWWILGYGDRIEVLKPVALRKEIGGILQEAAASYH